MASLQPLPPSPDPPLRIPSPDPAPDSWELADLEASMKKLLASSSPARPPDVDSALSRISGASSPPESEEDVDSFLKEALQNRDRLTILRLEQEVDKFMRNPKLQQLEFQPMPSSYMRLLAHRVAQHYNLQSSVVDSNIPESTRIIARKTPESSFPRLRLADIPGNNEPEDKPLHITQQKYEIKRRPRGARSNGEFNGLGDSSSRLNSSKSVEERKEEYNKARARIFSSSDLAGKFSEEEAIAFESSQNMEVFFNGTVRLEKNLEEPCELVTRVELNDGLARTLNGNTEREPALRYKLNSNRVAIFRDREKDRKDPDYDRSYDRYMQRFDPGFGVNLGPFGMQAMYAPLVNYNTEFPQLGGPTRPQMYVDPPLPQASQSMRGPWAGSSNSLGYGHPDLMMGMGSFNPGQLGPHSGSAVYMHQPQFPGPTMTYVHPQERFPKSISQSHLQHEGNFSQARRQ